MAKFDQGSTTLKSQKGESGALGSGSTVNALKRKIDRANAEINSLQKLFRCTTVTTKIKQ
jgi:hypothetical protein